MTWRIYEREASISASMGPGSGDDAQSAARVSVGENGPEAAPELPQRQRPRLDVRVRGCGGGANRPRGDENSPPPKAPAAAPYARECVGRVKEAEEVARHRG